MKLVGVNDKHEPKSALLALKNQNFIECDTDSFKILHIHQIRQKNTYIIYIESSPKFFDKFISQDFMYIKWQKCRLYEDLNLGRCFNCNGYGHSAKICTNETSCAHCAGDHSTITCTNKNLKNV